MLVDLHAHYPMRVVSDASPRTPARLTPRRAYRRTLGDRLRALFLRVLSIFFSHRYPWSGYRVTPAGMRAGGVRVALSVLTRPLDEFDLSKPYGWNPQADYFERLLRDLEQVEDEVGRHGAGEIRIVASAAELERAIEEGATALVHCLEGGFSLGDRPEEIARNVAELRRRGVVYITLAHLVYRQMATNANAIPFLSAEQYDRHFPQPAGEGLTERGAAAIRAMVENRVMLDISHMRQDALDETFALLDRLDPDATLPVLATHVGFRHGSQDYMLDEPTLHQIERRNGLVGLILAQHQLMDGMPEKKTRSFEDSRKVIFRHIDKIVEVTGGYDHVGIGTDFDGFIKPTMTGLDRMKDLTRLEGALVEEYGADAEPILSGNALRVLRQVLP
jgi:microsomal dipeptidase-like Zn-dependent dipeptidase